jgi:enoyl-CoA hydratase/carnithine racemase
MSEDLVLRNLDDGVLTLTLNRPERNNAFTVPMEHAYYDNLEEAAKDEAVRVIVLTGAGKSFCPGLDVKVLQEGIKAGRLETDKPRKPPTFPLSIPKPIIAAINGAAAGIGLTLSLTSDIRFAVRGAKLTTAWSRRGLVGEHGMTWLIPRLIGGARGMELMLSGRTLLTEEAHELGLIHQLTEPGEVLAAAQAYARDMATNVSPASMAFIKWQAYRDLQRTDFEGGLRMSTHLIDEMNTYPDPLEGVMSFVERRPPAFPGLPADFDMNKHTRSGE